MFDTVILRGKGISLQFLFVNKCDRKDNAMKKTLVMVIALICSAVAFSQQITTVSEIVSFMTTNDYRLCFSMTNNLDSLIMSTTGILERSTCKLLKVSILLDHSENMADITSFDAATNLCCEIEAELTGLVAWQRIGALSKFTNAMIEDGHPEVAFTASTNLLNVFQSNQCVDVDTNVWNVLFKPGGLDIMSPMDFIKANAAASLFRMDAGADISPYTNGIPHEILHEIIR